MATALASPDRLVVSDGSMNVEAGRTANLFNAAAPLALGLIGPLLVIMLLDPSALRNMGFMAVAILMPLLLAAVAIYIYSVLNPGDVAGLVADPSARVVEIVQSNAFASRRSAVAFADIASVRFGTHYDHDGYASERAVLVLESGDEIALPAGTDAAEVRALRAMLAQR